MGKHTERLMICFTVFVFYPLDTALDWDLALVHGHGALYIGAARAVEAGFACSCRHATSHE